MSDHPCPTYHRPWPMLPCELIAGCGMWTTVEMSPGGLFGLRLRVVGDVAGATHATARARDVINAMTVSQVELPLARESDGRPIQQMAKAGAGVEPEKQHLIRLEVLAENGAAVRIYGWDLTP